MNKRISLLVLLCLSVIFSFAQTPDHVVISQVYGGGGNTGAPFNRDFVELYNPTASRVNLAGWSLQYAGRGSNKWSDNQIALSGFIEPGRYFLIALGVEGNNGNALPVADFSSPSFAMANNSGKVALLKQLASLPEEVCPVTANIVDFLGYGTADCFEGADGTIQLGNSTAAHRKNNGCVDLNSNRDDFVVLAPNPRNSGAPGHSCQVNITVDNLSPIPVCINNNTGAAGIVSYSANTQINGQLNVFLSDVNASFTNAILIGSAVANGTAGFINVIIPANLPSGDNYRIRVDAATSQVYGQTSDPVEIINGAKNVSGVYFSPEPTSLTINWTNPPGCFDEIMIVGKGSAFSNAVPTGDGAAYNGNLDFSGNGTPFDGGKVLYKGSQTGPTITSLINGQNFYIKIFTRRGTDWSNGVAASAVPRRLPAPGEIVINQFNPGFAAASNEYIELVNNTSMSFDLSELAIRYQSPSSGNIAPGGGQLSGTLAPHSYWLLSSNTTPPTTTLTVGVTNNLDRDGGITTGFGGTAGQIALLRITDNLVLDALRYGNVTAGTFVEGGVMPAPTGNSGYKRKVDGVDNNDNSTDFETVANANIDLRNSQSRLAKEGALISAATNLKRIYVTGNAQIASNIILTEKLVLQAGKLALNDFHFTTQNIEGGNANAYVQTNGTGPLAIPVTGATPILFPVGRSTYNPVTLQHPGSLSWSVNVLDAVQATNPDGAVQRTWNITPSAVPTTGATVSFQYDEGDATQLGSAFDVADQVQVYHQHDGVWKKAGDPVDPAGAAGGIRTVTLSNWTQFSAFVLNGAAQGPLPVKFAGLRLFAQGPGLVLQFTVHNELGVDHYKVETSADGHHWEVRALLMPQSNNGATVQYEFRDARPLVADRYYRVQAMEETGVVSFSGVARARAKIANAGLQVAPNPVVGAALQYTCGILPAGNYTVRIFNGAGQPVLVTRMAHAGGWLSANLVLPHLHSGWYVLELAGPQVVRQTFLVR